MDFDRKARLQFLQIDDDIAPLLEEGRRILEPHIDSILDNFYAMIQRTPEMASMFASPARMTHAREMQRKHWMENVLSGRFDEAYFATANRIGEVHERVGLEPRWYLGGYSFVISHMYPAVITSYRWNPKKGAAVMAAVTKALFLDMDIAISVYLRATLARKGAAAVLKEHAARFEEDVHAMSEVVASAATQLETAAGLMSNNAAATSQQVEVVAAAADTASMNVQTAASATEELHASIAEIARQVAESTAISTTAVDEATRTNERVRSLAAAADKIGEVIKLINDIASQTNLLALNATIEAARAGDAGKGFAVVANEVKTLANQTSRATEDISAQVGTVQAATREAVDAIQGIGGTISHLNEIAAAIAAAVEQQGAATQEIARNAQEASGATIEVSDTITQVTARATETGGAAEEVLSAARDLTKQADDLRTKVDDFLQNLHRAIMQ
ncbi:globin-coupled sensor protein [Roseospira goensis]|uniref:Chromosome segregation ATPase n=1 Tax=Roseospira goensis TaxID=391922 RepID=A0A7W6WJK6_9PROT|nr:globin-coupled sensor protein [Roseospira goensis]MBB4284774.1 chromosome segregation ATPase [Roseospira goensis]